MKNIYFGVIPVFILCGCINTVTIPEMHVSCGQMISFGENLNCVQDKLRGDYRYKFGGAAFAEEYLTSARVVEERLQNKEISEAEAQKELMDIYRNLKSREMNQQLYQQRARAEIDMLNAQTEATKKAGPKKTPEIRCETSTNGRSTVCREW